MSTQLNILKAEAHSADLHRQAAAARLVPRTPRRRRRARPRRLFAARLARAAR